MDIKSLVKKAACASRDTLIKAFTRVKTLFSKTDFHFAETFRALVITKKRGTAIVLVSAITVMVMLMSVLLMKRNEITVFVDGNEVTSFTTLKTEGDEWLALSGVEINDGDKVVYEGNSIYIDRAFYVTVKADGGETVFRTVKMSAREAIANAGVELGESDIVSCELDSVLTQNSTIEISRVATSEVIEMETVKFETQKVNTDKLYVGQSEVKTSGQNGKIEHVYSVKYVDGVETERTLVEDRTIKEVVNKVVLVGTKVKPVVKTSGTPSSYKAVYTMKATAYTYGDDGGNRTSTGIRPYRGVVAVDPSIIPLGSKLYIETSDGKYIYGEAVAADTGGAIKGNKIDVFMESASECYSFGRRTVNVYVIG